MDFEEARRRLISVFEYQLALARMTSPPILDFRKHEWVLMLEDVPSHPSILRRRVGDANVEEPPPLLHVRRPKVPECPDPPASLDGWLSGAWDDPQTDVRPHPTLEIDEVAVAFDADPARVGAWDGWIKARASWIDDHRASAEALGVYNRLWNLYAVLQREGGAVELVLANGVVKGEGPLGYVEHPAVIQKLELTFDSQTPSFMVEVTDDPPQVLPGVPKGIETASNPLVDQFIEEFRANPLEPEGGTDWDGLMQRLAPILGSEGRFVLGARERAGTGPLVYNAPMILCRKRQAGLAGAIEWAIERIRKAESLPDGLLRLVGFDTSASHQEVAPPSEWEGVTGQPREILFAKPANEEQAAIARRLEAHGSVLVQGPPGTGKSHTIANLIGHLLAAGERVLVTSHTTKALRVLRGHLPTELQSFCVASLDSDRESNSELVQAVTALTTQLDEWTKERLTREAQVQDELRTRLLAALEQDCQALFTALNAETTPLEDDGRSVLPAEAAKWLSQTAGEHGWMPGPLKRIGPLPVSEGQVVDLYRFAGEVTPEEEARATEKLPVAEELLDPEQFDALIQGEEAALRARPDPSTWPGEAMESLDALRDLKAEIRGIIEAANTSTVWTRHVLEDALVGGPAAEPWQVVRGQCDRLASQSGESLKVLLDRVVEWTNEASPTLASEWLKRRKTPGSRHAPMGLLERFTAGGRMLSREVRIDGRPPRTADEMSVVALDAELRSGVLQLGKRLAKLTEGKFDVATLRQTRPAASLGLISRAIRDVFEWVTRWEALKSRESGGKGLLGPYLNKSSGGAEAGSSAVEDAKARLEELDRACELGIAIGEGAAARSILGHTNDVLSSNSSRVAAGLRTAIASRDAVGYDAAHRTWRAALELRRRWGERDAQLTALAQAAPAWAEAIRRRTGVHATGSVPGDLRQGWRWRCLADQVEARLQMDERVLLARVGETRRQLEAATAELIRLFAWLHLKGRITHKQRQALHGWATTVKKIGKGTGKLAPRRRAEARALLAQCQSAVPVWVMPLSKVYEAFSESSDEFGVVIVDEASQADVFSLLALALGKRLIVVGDDEQVSPLAVGTNVIDSQQLIDKHLADIPNNNLYGPRGSLYDLAQTSFGGTLRLSEHFRCVPEIIAFSNDLSYGGRIRPLRPAHQVRLPAVVSEFIPHGVRGDGKTNRAEAMRVCALVAAMCEQPEYAKASFGVISLLGDEQALMIDSHLRRHLDASEFEERRLVCGTAAQFQGDERDVVILSMVDSPGDGPLRLSDRPETKQRYNVAASRARDQLWVVHSLSQGIHLKNGDLRQRLLQFVEAPDGFAQRYQEVSKRAESPFEREVFSSLARAGYRIAQQVWLGHYRVDGVVSDAKGAVIVECDGERFHPPEQVRADMLRQAVLERLGHRFIRIRGARYYREKEGTMREVVEELGALGITPTFDPPEAGLPAASRATELSDRVRRRALELETEWQSERQASA